MKQSIHEMLTTHSGSLPRPPAERALIAARAAQAEPATYGHASHLDLTYGHGYQPDLGTGQGEFEAEVRTAVADTVRRQAAAGLTVVNDGEVSKDGYGSYLPDRLSGFDEAEQAVGDSNGHRGARERRDFPEFYGSRPDPSYAKWRDGTRKVMCCVGPIEWKNFAAVERDIDNLKAAAEGLGVEDVFMSALSPGDILRKYPRHYYRDDDEYVHAAADAMHREYKAIVDAGIILQVDCPELTTGSYPDSFSLSEFRKEIARSVEALNYATRDLPPERMRIHVCWGSHERPHSIDPEIASILDILLRARPAGITIVASNGRHAFEWQAWQDVDLPDGKVVIPGVIDSTTNIVEHPRTVADRIIRYATVLGKENVIAGTDCGFQPSFDREQVSPTVTWAKLHALAEGARLATRELWRLKQPHKAKPR